MQENENHRDHEDQCLDKRMEDRFDRGLDSGRGVVDDLVIHVGRKERLCMVHRLVDRFRSFELVGAGQKVNGHRAGWFSIEPAERVVIL